MNPFRVISHPEKGVYNKAMKVKIRLLLEKPVTNWTEFQRRVKHLLAVRLELETVLEWVSDAFESNAMQLIKIVKPQDDYRPSYGQDFWLLNKNIMDYGIQPILMECKESILTNLDRDILKVLKEVVKNQTDKPLIELKKQINRILKSLYDHIICTCPWEGKITGGPMLPNQTIKINTSTEMAWMTGEFEFLILGARNRDMNWIKDLKFPALSQTSQIWIHHGAKRNNY